MEGLRVAEMAAIVAASIGDVPEDLVARQIRNWATLGLLNWAGIGGAGETSPRIFDVDQVYRARLLNELTAMGMPPDEMRAVVGATWPSVNDRKQLELWNAAIAGGKAFLIIHARQGVVFTAALCADPQPLLNIAPNTVHILNIGEWCAEINSVPGFRDFMANARKDAETNSADDPYGWQRAFSKFRGPGSRK